MLEEPQGLKKPLLFSFLGISLDLFSTWLALAFFHAIEINPYGNQPLIFYPVVLGTVCIMYCGIKNIDAGARYKQLWTAILWIFITFPFISFIRNLLVIGGML